MTSDWAALTGRQVGSWRLDSLIRTNEERADFLGTDGTRDAWLQLIAADAPDAAAAVDSWKLAQKHSHESLVKVLGTGDADLNGTLYSWVALEPPDDDVSEVIATRPLENEEVRALLKAAASALAFLHERDLRHGSVTPPHMMILGESLKLSVDRIGPIGDDGHHSDLKQLGQTLVRSMTGSADGVRKMTSPFREIALGCLDPHGRGWSAQTVLTVLEGGKIPAPPVKPVPAPRAALHRQPEVRDVNPGLKKKWPVVLAAAAILVIAVLVYRSATSPGETAAAASPSPVSLVASESTPAHTPATAPAQAAQPALQGDWAVVAGQAQDFKSAKKQLDYVLQKSPKLKGDVYPPEGTAKRYFVVIGSAETRDGAEKLRRAARQQGAYRTYITKLARN